jgi:hypothetical protein
MSNAKSNTVSTWASMVMLRVSVDTALTSLNMGGLPSSYSDARQLGWRAQEEKIQARTSRTSARCLSVTHRSAADEANTPDAHDQNRAATLIARSGKSPSWGQAANGHPRKASGVGHLAERHGRRATIWVQQPSAVPCEVIPIPRFTGTTHRDGSGKTTEPQPQTSMYPCHYQPLGGTRLPRDSADALMEVLPNRTTSHIFFCRLNPRTSGPLR